MSGGFGERAETVEPDFTDPGNSGDAGQGESQWPK